jgi:hypothetical protein
MTKGWTPSGDPPFALRFLALRFLALRFFALRFFLEIYSPAGDADSKNYFVTWPRISPPGLAAVWTLT